MKPQSPETLPGLPGPLPAGERALWQGSPRWTTLARRALHVRGLAFYFAAVGAWQALEAAAAGASAGAIAATLAQTALLGGIVLGLGLLYAWWAARSTVYTITTRRIVLSFGVALPVTLNIPFSAIRSAAVRVDRDGTGDVPLDVTERRLSYVVLWPHVRPWRLGRVQPMLRSLPEAAAVAEILSAALVEAQEARRTSPATDVPAAEPRSAAPAQLSPEPRIPSPAGALRPAAA